MFHVYRLRTLAGTSLGLRGPSSSPSDSTIHHSSTVKAITYATWKKPQTTLNKQRKNEKKMKLFFFPPRSDFCRPADALISGAVCDSAVAWSGGRGGAGGRRGRGQESQHPLLSSPVNACRSKTISENKQDMSKVRRKILRARWIPSRESCVCECVCARAKRVRTCACVCVRGF